MEVRICLRGQARSLENIKKGEAISNIKEFEKAELFKLKQFLS